MEERGPYAAKARRCSSRIDQPPASGEVECRSLASSSIASAHHLSKAVRGRTVTSGGLVGALYVRHRLQARRVAVEVAAASLPPSSSSSSIASAHHMSKAVLGRTTSSVGLLKVL
jgi:hypothetical protein